MKINNHRQFAIKHVYTKDQLGSFLSIRSYSKIKDLIFHVDEFTRDSFLLALISINLALKLTIM
jgi:hypothetical protein